MEVKEDGEYKERGEEEEAPTQNKRSQRCSLGDVGNEADAREILSTQLKEKQKYHDDHLDLGLRQVEEKDGGERPERVAPSQR